MNGRATGGQLPSGPGGGSSRRLTLVVGCAALVTVTAWLVVSYRNCGKIGFPLDDAYIYASFARNTAEGHILTYNIEDGPTSGATGPLWVFALAPLFALTSHPLVGMMVLGGLLHVTNSLLGYALTRRLGASTATSLVAGLSVAISPHLVYQALSGMEAALCLTLVLAGLLCYLKGQDGTVWRVAGVLVLAVAGWTRPECFVLSLMALTHLAWTNRRAGPRVFAARFGGAVLACGCVLALWVLTNMHLAGTPFPSTFTAKAGHLGGRSALEMASAALRPLPNLTYLLATDSPLSVVIIMSLVAARLMTGSRGAPRLRSPVGEMGALWGLGGSLLVFVLARNVVTGGMGVGTAGRYVPVVFALVPVVLLVAVDRWDSLRGDRDRPVGGKPALVLWLAAPLLVSVVVRLSAASPVWDWLRLGLQFGGPPPHADFAHWLDKAILASLALAVVTLLCLRTRYPSGRALQRSIVVSLLVLAAVLNARMAVQYVSDVQTIEAIQVAMGTWLRQNTSPDDRIAAGDVGAVKYFSERYVIDVVGLVTPGILLYRAGEARGRPQAAATVDYAERMHPRFYALYTREEAKLAKGSGRRFVEVARFPAAPLPWPHPGEQAVYTLAK